MKLFKYMMFVIGVLAIAACSQNKTVVKVAPFKIEQEQINLSADALFKFNKATKEDLLPSGIQALDGLVSKLKTNYVEIKQISLVGHTDRLGSDDYNYRLGLARADTIKNYLIERGISSVFETSSAGKTQPVSKNCVGNKLTKELTECLAEDRRVVVTIQGIRKN